MLLSPWILADAMQITILNLAGKASPVVEVLRAALRAEETSVEIVADDACTPALFAERGFYIVVTAAKPGLDPTEPFAALLEQERPDLSGGPDGMPIDYGIIEVAASDASAAPRLDPVLASLGAHRVGHAALTGTAGAESAVDAAEEWLRKLSRNHEGDDDPTLS